MDPNSNPILNSKEKKQLNQAIKKISQYLNHRSHSEKELKKKLSKTFSSRIIEKSLEQAKERNWLEPPLELSKKILETLNKKNKSWKYIQSYLMSKELPLPIYSKEKEIEKAQNLIQKFSQNSHKKPVLQIKQYLANRSFESDIIDELLKESSDF
ncbi:MAG: hypothetical protein OXC37_01715 [Bdellovibrionaceae bacterium]|nr:hypothetical protein [Pseudobdellovibrionaceae bacterium]